MKFALMGFPIEYSLSPNIHKNFAAQFQTELSYDLIPTTVERLSETIVALQQQGYRGANVTQPLKQEILKYVKTKTLAVQQTQAANTLTFHTDGAITADNTDGIGFINALHFHVKESICNQSVLLIGAGGAASGILPKLMELLPSTVYLLNRDPERAKQLLQSYPDVRTFEEEATYQWIINATTIPAYRLENFFSNLHFKGKIVYDLTYQHEHADRDHFIETYQLAGFYDGLSMLVEQAAQAYFIWHGVRPKTDVLLK